MRYLLIVVPIAALAPLAAAQCGPWTLAASTGPSPRLGHVMAWDGKQIVLFGGYRGGAGFNNQTWTWNGTAWTQSTSSGPSARGNFALVNDQVRGCAILFGGTETGSNALADTWRWDTAAWVQEAPFTSPPGRYNHAMAYDAARDRIVLFGGHNGVSRLNDTWLYDGTTWTQVFPATSPSARSSHAMIYDSARQRVVLFGGLDGSFSNQTWEWNGSNWSLSPAIGPSGRQYLGMAFDEDRGVTVLTAGQPAGFGFLSDTWEYNGTAWTQIGDPGPQPNRNQHAMAYDPDHHTTLVHGGYAGNGNCVSSSATPTATATMSSRCRTSAVSRPSSPWVTRSRTATGTCC